MAEEKKIKMTKAEKVKPAKKAKMQPWEISQKRRKMNDKINHICRVILWRTLEAMILFVVLSTVIILTGSGVLPYIAFSISNGIGLTQSTNIYVAMANWIFPMLFFTGLATAVVFVILRKFVKFVNTKITAAINKPQKGEDDNL